MEKFKDYEECPLMGLALPDFSKMEPGKKYFYDRRILLEHGIQYILKNHIKREVDKGTEVCYQEFPDKAFKCLIWKQ